MKKPGRYLVDGKRMTVQEIADMLGVTLYALRCRRSRLGLPSYQLLVDMYRENQFGSDKWPRHRVDGRWMTRAQIAEMLGIRPHTLTNWLYEHKGQGIQDVVEYYRQHLQQQGQGGGRPPVLYRVGRKDYSVPQVARMFGVLPQSVRGVLRQRGGDMAATIRHYKEREKRKRRKAEQEILKILGF